MHVHIVNKVWDHNQGEWDIDKLTHRGTQLYSYLSIGGGPDMGCKVDINSCTDVCTHSKQGVATEMRWLGHKHTAIQGHPGFHQTMERGGPDISSQVDINSYVDACTHCKQGVGPQPGWMGHRQIDTQRHPTLQLPIHRGWTRHGV